MVVLPEAHRTEPLLPEKAASGVVRVHGQRQLGIALPDGAVAQSIQQATAQAATTVTGQQCHAQLRGKDVNKSQPRAFRQQAQPAGTDIATGTLCHQAKVER